MKSLIVCFLKAQLEFFSLEISVPVSGETQNWGFGRSLHERKKDSIFFVSLLKLENFFPIFTYTRMKSELQKNICLHLLKLVGQKTRYFGLENDT